MTKKKIKTFKDLENFVQVRSISLDADYSMIALTGEVGEAANAIKKAKIYNILGEEISMRASSKNLIDYSENLKEELGDVLFYVIQLIINTENSLEDIIDNQILKLETQDNMYNLKFKK